MNAMPNIIEQRVDASGIYIKASDGREITLTKQQIRNMTRKISPKAAQVARVKQEIEDFLGAEQVPIAVMDFDFDQSDGTPLSLVMS